MLVKHIHSEVYCASSDDVRFIEAKWYQITDGVLMDEQGTNHENVRSIEALCTSFPSIDFNIMVSRVVTY